MKGCLWKKYCFGVKCSWGYPDIHFWGVLNRTWQFAPCYLLFNSMPEDWHWILLNCCDTTYYGRIMKMEATYSCKTLTHTAQSNAKWGKQTLISLIINRQLFISVYAGKTMAVEAIYCSEKLAPTYQKRRCPNTVRCPNCSICKWLIPVRLTGCLVLYVTKRRLCNVSTRRRV
jgi:hypothetical protein